MDYLALLEDSYKIERQDDEELTKYEYLSDWIFQFTTYDGSISDSWGKIALEVCIVITDKLNFRYQENHDNYVWYLLMCNLPFFRDKIEWGTSIRGAWWSICGSNTYEIDSCGIYAPTGKQILTPLVFDEIKWTKFIHAMCNFTKLELKV